MLKASELKEKLVEELREEEKKLSQKVFKLRMEAATGQLTNPKLIQAARRDLARVKTVIRAKVLRGDK